jgi:adenylosuccinate lyase
MVVYPDRMRENLDRSRGVVFSGTVLLELARRGVSREDAYEWVQRNAMRSFHERTDFKRLVLADPDISRVLTPAEIGRAFDLDEQLRNVDVVFERVFVDGGARKREDVGISAPNESEAWQALGVGPQRKGTKD